MKVVLTGATGLTGTETLRQLVARPDVERVTCLVRRPVDSDDAKVESVVLDDFTRYDEALVARLADHDAAIWTLGTRYPPHGDKALHERLTVDYTLRFAETVAGRDFRFCYVSGWGSSPEGNTVWFLGDGSTLKGRAEAGLRDLAARYPRFRVHCFRPAKILPSDAGPLTRAFYGPLSVRVEKLAAEMIRVAVDAPQDAPPVFENRELR